MASSVAFLADHRLAQHLALVDADADRADGPAALQTFEGG
jgi:hypothetical protein